MASSDTAGTLLAELDAVNPGAGSLARLAALAARIEPEILRALRLNVLPGVSVTAEGDVWFSHLVQTRSPSTITLLDAALPALRAWCADDRPRFATTCALIARVHRQSNPLVQLEDGLIEAALKADDPDASGRKAVDAIDAKLSTVTAALLADERRSDDLSSWALRALPRLPKSARRTAGYWTLFFAATARRPDVAVDVSDLPPTGALDAMFEDVFLGVRKVGIDVRWRGLAIELSLTPPGGSGDLQVPATRPVIVQVRSMRSNGLSVPVAVSADWTRVPVEGSVVTIRSIDGMVFRITPGASVRHAVDTTAVVPLGLARITRRGARSMGYLIAAPRLVATVAHAGYDQEGDEAEVVIDGRAYVGRVAALDRERDVAILVVDSEVLGVPPLVLAPLGRQPDAIWSSFVFEDKGHTTRIQGRIDGIEPRTGQLILVTTDLTRPPVVASGAPVLVDNAVVGHLTAYRESLVLGAVPAEAVSDVLARVQAPVATAPAQVDDWAIVVGISRYKSLPSLQSPANDARAFADWLMSPSGGHVPPENITLVVSTDMPDTALDDGLSVEPTESTIVRAFEKLMVAATQNQSRTSRVGRRLYIYFSGHGMNAAPSAPPALLPANWRHDILMRGVSPVEYVEWFRRSHAFSEIVMFLDCGVTDKSRRLFQTPYLSLPARDEQPEQVSVFAAWPAHSMERVFGDPPTVHGIFTYVLLEALTGGASNASGQITSVDVERYVRYRLPALQAARSVQAPFFLSQDAPIVLVRQRVPPLMDVMIVFEPSLVGAHAEVLDGTFAPQASHTVGDTPWWLQLPMGIYVVQIRGRTTPFQVLPGAPTNVTVTAT